MICNKFLLSKCLAVHFNCDVDMVNDINQLTCKLLKPSLLNRAYTGLHINVNGNHLLNKLKLNNFEENILLSLRQSILMLNRDLPYIWPISSWIVHSLVWFFSEASWSFENKFNPYSTWKLFNYLKNDYPFSLSLLFFQLEHSFNHSNMRWLLRPLPILDRFQFVHVSSKCGIRTECIAWDVV